MLQPIPENIAAQIRTVIAKINERLLPELEHHVLVFQDLGYEVVVGPQKDTIFGAASIERILGFLEGIEYNYNEQAIAQYVVDGLLKDKSARFSSMELSAMRTHFGKK
jgi:hypothetical protein